MDKKDLLWRVIGRFDFYIGSTNAKAALLIAFNTFVAGGVLLKSVDIWNLFGDYKAPAALASIALLVAALAALVSLWFTFKVIRPYLDSERDPNKYHSMIFFNHVAEWSSDRYCDELVKLDEACLEADLARQAHALAKGLRLKFEDMIFAVNAVIWVQLPALGIVVILLIITLSWDILVEVANR